MAGRFRKKIPAVPGIQRGCLERAASSPGSCNPLAGMLYDALPGKISLIQESKVQSKGGQTISRDKAKSEFRK